MWDSCVGQFHHLNKMLSYGGQLGELDENQKESADGNCKNRERNL